MPHNADLSQTLGTLLRELLYGPAPDAAYMLNRGDRGLLASLDALSSEIASRRPGAQSSVAAHVDHLRYGLHLLNRWSHGEDPWSDADWAASWERQEATDEEWRRLREELTREAQSWLAAITTHRSWNERSMLEAIGSIVHLAYHVGAIRQIAPPAAGPPATH